LEENLQLMTQLAKCFNYFDKDKSGYLDSKELEKFIPYLGIKMTPTEIAELQPKLDKNKDGVIGFNEACDWYLAYRKEHNKKSS